MSRQMRVPLGPTTTTQNSRVMSQSRDTRRISPPQHHRQPIMASRTFFFFIVIYYQPVSNTANINNIRDMDDHHTTDTNHLEQVAELLERSRR